MDIVNSIEDAIKNQPNYHAILTVSNGDTVIADIVIHDVNELKALIKFIEKSI